MNNIMAFSNFNRMCLSLLFLCVSPPLAFTYNTTQYAGSRVFRVYPQSDNDLLILQDFRQAHNMVEFWRKPSNFQTTGRCTLIMVPKIFIIPLSDILQSNGIQYENTIEDVQKLMDEQFFEMSGRLPPSNLADFDYSEYHPYEEIRQWVIDFASEHSDIVEEFVVTKSYEGREMRGIKISVNPGPTKKSIWFEAGIHAREWIAPATVMYIANQLVSDYKAGVTRVQRILEKWDFFIIPSINVDGYAYTWSTDRLWRKTRRPNPGFGCVGTDGNRNFPYKWGYGDGASPWPCNNVYSGEKPLSEIEVKGLTDFALARASEQEIRIFVDWHSWGQLWLIPWSYDEAAELPEEFPDVLAAATEGVNAQKNETGMEYTAGASAKLLYEFSGGSNDWGFAELGAKYSYVIELRDQDGEYGFLLPEDQITDCGRENYAATLALAEYVLDNDF